MKIVRSLLLIGAFLSIGGIFASAQTLSTFSNMLSTPTGEQKSVAQIGAGKVTIVSFWATWCKPCKAEMAAVAPKYQELKESGVEYIAVSIDNTKTIAKVAPYLASKGYQFPVLLDPNSEVFRAANGTDVPYTLVFNSDGTLHAKHNGFLEGDEEKLVEEATALTKKN
ncbi:MAG: TlpA family protein disulfide reductase [Armatimonadetes bacterium]|nr:TlpA family protein disulfide reductase [Armatimonadota bacterium]